MYCHVRSVSEGIFAVSFVHKPAMEQKVLAVVVVHREGKSVETVRGGAEGRRTGQRGVLEVEDGTHLPIVVGKGSCGPTSSMLHFRVKMGNLFFCGISQIQKSIIFCLLTQKKYQFWFRVETPKLFFFLQNFKINKLH